MREKPEGYCRPFGEQMRREIFGSQHRARPVDHSRSRVGSGRSVAGVDLIETLRPRVGSYDLDNSNFTSANLGAAAALLSSLGGGTHRTSRRRQLRGSPCEDIARHNSVYKRAVEDLSGKKAALQNRNRGETSRTRARKHHARNRRCSHRIDEKLADAELSYVPRWKSPEHNSKWSTPPSTFSTAKATT